jgi:hypothetical protein
MASASRAARTAFFRAVKEGEFSGACSAYASIALAGNADKFMLSALVLSAQRRSSSAGRAEARAMEERREKLGKLWESVAQRDPESGPSLDAHLSSDFITSFGAHMDLKMSLKVLEAAQEEGLASTRVHNAYLRACAHVASATGTASAAAGAHAVTEAERVIGIMESKRPTDTGEG